MDWTDLETGIQYFFKIFPFTNTGNDVNYKHDGTPLTATVTTKEQPDSDATLTSSLGITEPVDLPTTADTPAEAVSLFDFTLTDGYFGGGDGLSTDVTQLVFHTSGTGDFSKVSWRLNGADASNVAGVYDAGENTLTFSGLSISIANSTNETYTLNGFFSDNTNITEHLPL